MFYISKLQTSIKLQSIYRGNKVRKKIQYFKLLPRDIQRKIIWYINESIYINSINKSIFKIINKRIYNFVNYFQITHNIYIDYLINSPEFISYNDFRIIFLHLLLSISLFSDTNASESNTNPNESNTNQNESNTNPNTNLNTNILIFIDILKLLKKYKNIIQFNNNIKIINGIVKLIVECNNELSIYIKKYYYNVLLNY